MERRRIQDRVARGILGAARSRSHRHRRTRSAGRGRRLAGDRSGFRRSPGTGRVRHPRPRRADRRSTRQQRQRRRQPPAIGARRLRAGVFVDPARRGRAVDRQLRPLDSRVAGLSNRRRGHRDTESPRIALRQSHARRALLRVGDGAIEGRTRSPARRRHVSRSVQRP